MALPTPNLDDRTFQELVDEARRLIPHYCPRWTDHNLSDPGITLLELFAGMVETLLYRLNRVPDKSYITFMSLMGVRLQPPAAARVGLTFWLSGALGPQAQPVIIPADTEVSTVQPPNGTSVTFSTVAAGRCSPPRPIACLASADDQRFRPIGDILRERNDTPLAVFGAKPAVGDSFSIVDANDLSGHILELTFRGPIKGVGVTPEDPPWVWQAWRADGWARADIERDGTGGLNRVGRVVIHLPRGMARRERDGVAGYWLRCCFVQPTGAQQGYEESPMIETLQVASLGITVEAIHASSVSGEVVGRSSGEPGQIFQLERRPVLQRRDDEHIEVLHGTDWEPWSEREHFAGSRPSDMHYTLDSVSGQIAFGPRIREPDGSEVQYGAKPAPGSLIRMARYRTGGGTAGNVGRGTLTVLRGALSYVDRVTNRDEAAGGLDAETIERARLRAPQFLRTSERAVTAEDYEHLALAAGAGVRRARCVAATSAGGEPTPGVVRLLLVPAVEPAERGLTPQRLGLAERRGLVDAVRAYLDSRRPLGTVLAIGEPPYVRVSVTARIRPRPDVDGAAVAREAYLRLERFLNPLVGGPEGKGWPFGRPLYASEVYALLQAVPGVEYIDQVELRREDPRPEVLALVSIPPDGLIISGQHELATF